MQEPTLDRLIRRTERFAADRDSNLPLGPESAISQDVDLYGLDVDDYVSELEEEFGSVVRTIPWLHYTDQTGSVRGCKACVVAPVWIPWILLKVAFLGKASLKLPEPENYPRRLTLAQIAQAIDDGGWPQDYWP